MHYSTVTLLALSCMLLAFVNPGLAAAECVNGIQKEIIDNEDVTRFTTSGGAWTKITMNAVSNRARHYNETMMRTVKAANQVAYFDASGLSTGTYEVATFWQAGAARYPKVNYSIVHAGGVDMVKVNQRDVQPDIADFFVLGNYTFTNNQAGAGVYINSGPRNANFIIADAVSFSSVCTETSTGPDCPAGSKFEVTGADAYPDFNGCYKQDGTSSGKPNYYKVNADGSFTDNKRWNIYPSNGIWRFFDSDAETTRYKVVSTDATPPTTGWLLASDNTATNIALTYN